MQKGTLFLIPTVLASDTSDKVLSPQIRDIITNTRHFFTENIRTARRFISELNLGIKIDTLNFYLLDKDTPAFEIEKQFALFESGKNIGLLSEAGCPGIADPGAVAVALAHKKNIKVVPLAGPSAILLALMGSGMNGQSFAFYGYLPIDRNERIKTIRQLETDVFKKKQTQIFMETPFRNNQLLEDILLTCRPDTLLCIASEITATTEFLKTHPIQYWKTHVPDLHKKPTVFCLGR
jgi:16S rRNA (cytidine1402-2'-O)-methyltransferase